LTKLSDLDNGSEKDPEPWRLQVKLNDFALRSFRDIADQDYIAARANYKLELWPQFFWAAQQTVEKYLKCILLLGRVEAQDVRHSLNRGLGLCRSNDLIGQLPGHIEEFVALVDSVGTDRYFEFAYVVRKRELLHLDWTVWALRQYCDVFLYLYPDESSKNKVTDRIINSLSSMPEKVNIPGGYLEKVLESPKQPARTTLTWRNLFVGNWHRKLVPIRSGIYANNSPLSMYPDQLGELQKYVYLSPKAVRAFSARLVP
jgi:HEPN domain-containing protein